MPYPLSFNLTYTYKYVLVLVKYILDRFHVLLFISLSLQLLMYCVCLISRSIRSLEKIWFTYSINDLEDEFNKFYYKHFTAQHGYLV